MVGVRAPKRVSEPRLACRVEQWHGSLVVGGVLRALVFRLEEQLDFGTEVGDSVMLKQHIGHRAGDTRIALVALGRRCDVLE